MIYEKATKDDLLPEITKILKEATQKEVVSNRITGQQYLQNKLIKGLFIDGITGSGKTHTLYAIRSVVKGWGECSEVENWVKLLYEVRRDNFAKANSIIDEITKKQFVFIDDIGAEKNSDWNVEILYLIINETYEKGHTLFITTNLDSNQLITRYGERLVSRILAMCEKITMPEKDLRLQQHGNK